MGSVYDTIAATSQSTRRDLFDANGHICGLFRDTDERYEVLLPFIKEGLEKGERAFHTLAASDRDKHVERLTTAGIDVEGAIRSGQLVFSYWADIYRFNNGSFDRHSTYAYWARLAEESVRMGYTRHRAVSLMEWAVEAERDELIEYEAEYEETCIQYLSSSNSAIICCYNLQEWSGDLIMRTLRTHPLVIVGGNLHENPFYIEPAEVLADLKIRRESRGTCC